MNEQILVKVPGKLMLAGEFAVLEPGHRLLVTAVDRFIYVTIEASEQNKLTLTDFQLENLDWGWNGNQIDIQHTDTRLPFVHAAMETAFQYLRELGVAVYPVAISITSELDDASGIKYGLGSSAAVVTGMVRAILTQFLGKAPDQMLVFKLASIAHVKIQGNGSGADIAASAFHGVLEYTSFQAEWLLAEMAAKSNVRTLAEKGWPYLTIKPATLPNNLKMCVAWTGSAASTKQLVRNIKELRKKDAIAYTSFLQQSEQALSQLLEGMRLDDADRFLQGIRNNRSALAQLGRAAGVEIETKQLHELAMAAESVDGAGKLSGAGGGDCGIAFIPGGARAEELQQIWRQLGITPLDIQVYERAADE